jgi:hypothetical protein
LPISQLPNVSKGFEKFLLKKLLPLVEMNRLIPNDKFFFRQTRSTIEQIHQIIRNINETLENKQFSDISQAFDKIWYCCTSVQIKKAFPSELFPFLKILFI